MRATEAEGAWVEGRAGSGGVWEGVGGGAGGWRQQPVDHLQGRLWYGGRLATNGAKIWWPPGNRPSRDCLLYL